MSSDPLVSVVIPTYNRAAVVCRTIDNVFEQTYRNIEVIVVDDGSTDNTQAVLAQYGNRIQVAVQANAGPAIARNRGAKLAHGELLAFQDSDDLWKPSKLQRQVNLLQKNRAAPCCLCNVLMRMVNGKPFTSFDHSLVRMNDEEGIWLNVLDVLATRFILFNQAVVIRRELFEKVGGFAEDLKYLEDYDLPLRLALEGPWAIIREPLVFYGDGSPASFSEQARRDPALLRECEQLIYERILGRLNGDREHADAVRSLKRRMGMSRRQLLALRLDQASRPIARALNKMLRQFDRYRMAAFRRSPWFPQPRLASVELEPAFPNDRFIPERMSH